MKIRKTSKTTPKCWELDLGLVNRRRVREFFASEKEAQAAFKERLEERKLNGENALAQSPRLRLEWFEAQKRLETLGVTIHQVIDHYERTGGKAKPIPMSDAVENCLSAKRLAGCRETTLRVLAVSLKSLAKAYPLMTDDVMPGHIEEWARKSRGKTEQPITLHTVRSRLIDARTFFNFCLKRRYVAANPCANIERVRVEEKPPGIHTVAEVEALLKAALKYDRALIGYLAPIYFGGLRPAESAALTKAEVHDGVIEVQGHKAKGRRRRFIPINDTLKAWLAVRGVKFGVPEQFNRLRKIRKKSGVPWHHDCIRHSFCSYALPVFGALKTAEWAGHSEQILFAHYRERVRPDDAKAFWALRP